MRLSAPRDADVAVVEQQLARLGVEHLVLLQPGRDLAEVAREVGLGQVAGPDAALGICQN
jgi:hypothetical protein